MKSNVNMMRALGDFAVTQRTKDTFFNATDLLKQWNSVEGNSKKELKDFWLNKNTKQFIKALIKVYNLDKGNSPYVKSKASRGVNAGTWMHPTLFVKFAMWLSPEFEVTVINFISDHLIISTFIY